MQTLFDTHYPSLDIEILGVNDFNRDAENALMSAEADIPWLQDVDANDDSVSDVWQDWNVTYRDVQVVDRDGEVSDIYNVSSNSLSVAANFIVLRDMFISAAATPALSNWQSPVEPLDTNADGVLTPLDALVPINEINDGSGGALSGNGPLVDVDGNGLLTPLDPLLVINHLNTTSSASALASSASVTSRAATFDSVFASYADDVAEDEDEDEGENANQGTT